MHSDKKNPLISVILPVYNCERYVSQAIESILNQSFSDFELLIADDGSRDQSRKIIDGYAAKDPRIIILHNNTNKGKVATVNKLFQRCQGKYLTIHDADDFSHPERFEKQIQTFVNDRRIAMCGTSFYTVNKNNVLIRENKMSDNYDEIKKNITNSSQFHGPTIIIKKNIIQSVGGLYRRFFFVAEDIDLCERIVEKYYAINLDKPLYYYRIHRKSLTKNINLYNSKRYALKDLLIRLRNERKENGIDSLWLNKKNNELSDYYKIKVLEWDRKKEIVFLDGIERNIFYFFYLDAMLLSLKWIVYQPLKYKPYTTLLYVLMKYAENYIKRIKIYL